MNEYLWKSECLLRVKSILFRKLAGWVNPRALYHCIAVYHTFVVLEWSATLLVAMPIVIYTPIYRISFGNYKCNTLAWKPFQMTAQLKLWKMIQSICKTSIWLIFFVDLKCRTLPNLSLFNYQAMLHFKFLDHVQYIIRF